MAYDSQGKTLKRGQVVACNVSGSVGKGMLMSDKAPFRVKLFHNCAGMSPGHISRVRNPTSLLIIEDPLDDEFNAEGQKSCPNCGQCPV